MIYKKDEKLQVLIRMLGKLYPLVGTYIDKTTIEDNIGVLKNNEIDLSYDLAVLLLNI